MAVTGLFGKAFFCYLLCVYIGKVESSTSVKWNPDSVVGEPGPGPKPEFDFAAFEASLPSNRIAHGTTSSANKYPFMVSLRRFVGSGNGCGGALISEEWVLTAAHCTPWSFTNHKAYINDFSISQTDAGEQIFGIEKWIINPYYNASYSTTHDVALIKLDGKVSGITPAKVTRSPNDAGLPAKATTAGWGKLFEEQSGQSAEFPDLMQELEVYHYPWTKEACTPRLTGKICYGNPPKGPCSGDSGSPLFFKNSNNEWEVIGVASMGICEHPTLPFTYASLGDDYIRKWITDLTGV